MNNLLLKCRIMLILSLKYLSLYIFYISALILAGCIAHGPAFYVNKSRRIPFLDPGHAHAREVEYLLVKGYRGDDSSEEELESEDD